MFSVSASPFTASIGLRSSRQAMVAGWGKHRQSDFYLGGCGSRPLVGDRCRVEEQPVVELERGHRAACWHADRVAALAGSAA
jgi:hypothetical protein